MTIEGSQFNSRQRQGFLSSKQRPEQIRGPPTLVSWTRLRDGQVGQPPESLTYKGRYVFEIIGDMVLVNLAYVVKEFLRNLGTLFEKFHQAFPRRPYICGQPSSPPMGTGDSSWWQRIRRVKLTAHLRLLMGVRTEYSYLPTSIYGLFKDPASSPDYVATHCMVGSEL
jgi:hypothetical protein